ncbi:efflux RND transporter permease subunit [uncultured Parabacteroides sp.]|uniref:efflux RND transporter permease subunit n=1 Tax=uncultured Parabacteroides sp. TaxID=512312 RepID=UPI0025910B01|nr:efflux RND transporter permease subunit [uncultured Parabacteroides sp.]
MKKKRGLIELAMHYNQITLLLIFLLVLLGIYGLVKMPKQEFPEFTIRQGVVVGVYPGATSSEVEEQLAKPLERYLFTFKEVKKRKTYSMSRDGLVYVMVELNDDVNNKDEVWSKIKLGLQNFKSQLPIGVLALIANDDFGDTSALLITLESEDKTYRELEKYLETLEDRLRRIESVSNLRRYGVLNEQIGVYLDKEKMTAYGLDSRILLTTLFTQGFTTSGGTVKGESLDIPVHFSVSYPSEKEIGEQIIYSDNKGNMIRLKDIARIVREYPEPDSYITNNGKKAIILSMEMREGNNIVEYGREVDEILGIFQKELPDSVSIRRIADQPKVVNESVTSFIRDLFVSIIIVILVMMFLFPFRSAVVAATSIPISIFISIGVMYVSGIPLNTTTLAALIVVLGMIVDNSIIVIDAYLEKLDQGLSRWNAAISSAKDYFASILLATLCICVIFFPLLFTMTGQMHDFVEHFPWTITISLMISLVIAMVFIPLLEYAVIKKGLHHREEKETKSAFNLLDIVQSVYEKTLKWTFRFPKTTIGIGVFSILLALLMISRLDLRMMPVADRDQFAVEIYLPQGTPLHRTAEVCDSLYAIMKQDERILSVTSFVGMASPRFQTTYAPNLAGKNYAQFIVNTASAKATVEILDDYTDRYADYFPNAYVKFKQLDYQTASSPLEIRFSGEDIALLKQAADSMMEALREIDELEWIHTNYEELQPEIRVKLDPVEASRLGITKAMAATDMAIRYDGLSVSSVWEGDYELPVHLKADRRSDRQPFNQVEDEYIPTAVPGVSVPLRQVSTVEAGWNEGQIVRRNGVRTISVMAQVKRGYTENSMQKKIEKVVESRIEPSLHEGVSMEYGGAKEADQEIIAPLLRGLLIAVVIIFFFLLFNFKKIGLALAALSSLLLCLFGASFGLWISDMAFSVTCVLGVISLMGIIVRNAIIMFEHAQDLRINHHFSPKDAAFDAGKRRMLPIFLTSATTAVGVVPMIISQSSLWTPMGVVICAGTVFAMILAVTILPVFYWKIFGNK